MRLIFNDHPETIDLVIKGQLIEYASDLHKLLYLNTSQPEIISTF